MVQISGRNVQDLMSPVRFHREGVTRHPTPEERSAVRPFGGSVVHRFMG